jgi:hypothetical protein
VGKYCAAPLVAAGALIIVPASGHLPESKAEALDSGPARPQR